MAHNGNIITAPVSILDVQSVLGTSNPNLDVLCKSDRINKWARYKPVTVANVLRQITQAELSNAKYGLTPALNSMLFSKSDSTESGTSPVASATELETVLNSNEQWTYNKPAGAMASPFRLSDFSCPSDNNPGYGYYHDTHPPVDNVVGKTFNLSAIKTCAENTAITSTAGDAIYNWKLNDANNTSPLFSGLAFMYGNASGQNVNNADSRAIPLPLLLGMTNGEHWRLAVAIQVPVGASLSYMRLFTSKYTFIDAQSLSGSAVPPALMPSMGTNQYMCQLIVDYAAYLKNHTVTGDALGNKTLTVNNPSFRLPACLCVVKNMYMSSVARSNSSTPYTHSVLIAASTVYSSPSLLSRFDIIVNDDVDFSADEIKAYSLVSIGTEGTGNYAQFGPESYKRVYINNVVAHQLQAVSVQTNVYYKITYQYVIGFNGTTPITTTNTINSYVTLQPGDTLQTWSLAGGPGAVITNKQQSMNAINN